MLRNRIFREISHHRGNRIVPFNVKQYAQLTTTLYHTAKPASTFECRDEHSKAFSNLKGQLSPEIHLKFHTPNDMFVLHCDASNHTIAAELSQVQNGKEETIAYASHVLLPVYRKYCTTRKELLAVVKFTRHFGYYLLGRKFTIHTDHNSLIWLTRFKFIQGQLARWLEQLSQYNFQLLHRPGATHQNADSLSRIPDSIPLCHQYKPGVEEAI